MEAMAHLPHEAARRGTPWYERIIEAGGYPRQFSAYQPKALTRQDRSIFRDGLNRGYGQEQRVGPYWLSSVDVSIQHRPLSELQFNVGADNGRGGFGLRYDGLGYDDAEIEAMVARICDLLELDPIAMILK
jgi:hypothetical protein